MSLEEIFEVIVSHTRDVFPALEDHEFKHTDEMRHLGLNSIDRSEVVMMTLEILALNIPMTELAGAKNFGELARIIHAKQFR